SVVDSITAEAESTIEHIHAEAARENSLRLSIVNEATRGDWSDDQLREGFQRPEYVTALRGLMNSLQGFMYVHLDRLVEQFGRRVAEAFWAKFTIRRGEIESLTYPTEHNPFDEKPMVRMSDRDAFCPGIYR